MTRNACSKVGPPHVMTLRAGFFSQGARRNRSSDCSPLPWTGQSMGLPGWVEWRLLQVQLGYLYFKQKTSRADLKRRDSKHRTYERGTWSPRSTNKRFWRKSPANGKGDTVQAIGSFCRGKTWKDSVGVSWHQDFGELWARCPLTWWICCNFVEDMRPLVQQSARQIQKIAMAPLG